jgi:regulatory protein
MSEITSIERQKKRDNRVNVFVDGNFFVGLTDNELISYDIYKGKKLEIDELNKIRYLSSYGKIKDKAMSLISIRPRSKKELKDKLILKKYDLSLIEKVINDLVKEKLLDDKVFARQWIYHRTEFSGHGKRRIEMELFKKGVAENIIKKEIPKIQNSQEFIRADELAFKKYPTIKAENKYKKREKLSAFLARKGYSWDIIKKVLSKLKD